MRYELTWLQREQLFPLLNRPSDSSKPPARHFWLAFSLHFSLFLFRSLLSYVSLILSLQWHRCWRAAAIARLESIIFFLDIELTVEPRRRVSVSPREFAFLRSSCRLNASSSRTCLGTQTKLKKKNFSRGNILTYSTFFIVTLSIFSCNIFILELLSFG